MVNPPLKHRQPSNHNPSATGIHSKTRLAHIHKVHSNSTPGPHPEGPRPVIYNRNMNREILLQWKEELLTKLRLMSKQLSYLDALLEEFPEEQTVPQPTGRKYYSKHRKAADATYRTIRDLREPVKRVKLYQLVTAQGYLFQGKTPLSTFSAMLSHDPRFIPVYPRGSWALAEWLQEPTPAKDERQQDNPQSTIPVDPSRPSQWTIPVGHPSGHPSEQNP